MQHDPIADFIVIVKNAQAVYYSEAIVPFSKIKEAVIHIMKINGYFHDFEKIEKDGKPYLKIFLKYFENKPVIEEFARVSKSSRRIYHSYKNIPSIKNGLGILILSTSKGLMTDRQAVAQKVGGELLCYVY